MLCPICDASCPVTPHINLNIIPSLLPHLLTVTGRDLCINQTRRAEMRMAGSVRQYVLACSCLRAGPFHSPKVQSSPPFAHSSGSFKQQSPQKQSLLSTLQKPNASLPLLTNGLHSASPKSPKSSNHVSSLAQETDLKSPAALKVNEKKKKRKKKRQHSEVLCDTGPATPTDTTTATNPVETADGQAKRKKKKKKRKRGNDDGEKVAERECVPSHLDTSNQEEDWCQAGMWSLKSHPETKRSEQKPQLSATTPTQRTSDPKEQRGDSVKLKKKKKRQMQLTEALENTTSACSAMET